SHAPGSPSVHTMSILIQTKCRRAGRRGPLHGAIAAACLLFAAAPLHAVPVEIDLSGGYSYRAEDSFDRGMKQFRSSLSPYVLNTVTADRYQDNFRSDLSVRVGGLLGDSSYFGFTYGQYQSPDMKVREARSDITVFDIKYNFRIPYFLLTYT